MSHKAKIIGIGSALPPYKYSTSDLKKYFPKIDPEENLQKIGVHTRYFVRDFETDTIACSNSELTVEAARKAIENANIGNDSIDLIVSTSASADFSMPNLACQIQKELEAENAACISLIAGCGGFTNALTVACQFVENGQAETALVTGSEVLSPYLDLKNKKCIDDQAINVTIFGDGAGAVLIRRCNDPGIISNYISADGKRNPLVLECGGSKLRPNDEALRQGKHFWDLNFRLIVGLTNKFMETAVNNILKNARITINDIDWIIPHQPTLPLIHRFAEQINFPLEKMLFSFPEVGDLANACLPVSLDMANRSKIFKKGDLILLVAAGAGWTFGANLIKWE